MSAWHRGGGTYFNGVASRLSNLLCITCTNFLTSFMLYCIAYVSYVLRLWPEPAKAGSPITPVRPTTNIAFNVHPLPSLFRRDESRITYLCLTVALSVHLYIYTVSGKKGATLFLLVTLRNVNRFSKFFYHHTLQ